MGTQLWQNADAFDQAGEVLMRKVEAGTPVSPAEVQAARERMTPVLREIGVVADTADRALTTVLEARISRLHGELVRNLGMAGAAIGIVLLLSVLFARTIQGPIGQLTGIIGRFKAGDFKQDVPYTDHRNQIGDIARALKTFQDMGAQQALTLAALDGSPTMLMITDPEERITYVSSALGRLIRQLEPEFRAFNPSFSLEWMQGQHIDCYRTNNALKRELISDNGETRKVRYVIGGRTILVDMSYHQERAEGPDRPHAGMARRDRRARGAGRGGRRRRRRCPRRLQSPHPDGRQGRLRPRDRRRPQQGLRGRRDRDARLQRIPRRVAGGD